MSYQLKDDVVDEQEDKKTFNYPLGSFYISFVVVRFDQDGDVDEIWDDLTSKVKLEVDRDITETRIQNHIVQNKLQRQ